MEQNNILKQTLNNIDWEQIATQIVFHSYFNRTKDIFLFSPQVFNNDDIQFHLNTVSTLVKLLDEGVNFDSILFDSLNDSEENHLYIENLNKGIVADFKQLNFVCVLLENIFSLKTILPGGQLKEEALELLNGGQKLKQKFINPLRKFIDKNGSVYLERHPKLAAKITERNNLEKKIRDQIQRSLKDEDISKRLQFESYDIVNDRFVIPIRSDSYSAKIGLIISRSSTGHTLFVEPSIVRELCNKRLLIISEIDEIVNEICSSYSTLLDDNSEYVRRVYNTILSYDYLLTQSKYSIHKSFTKPEISTDKSILLNSFVHPLIPDCRPNNIEIPSLSNGLIISGPNTGGKTVSIKTIIVCHVFLKLGFFIPAVKAKLPLLNDIFYFDSDYQDLTSGLSSFAGETSAILEMLANIQDNSLIAADEIFNSTSSDEASSLAISIITYLTNVKDSKVLISTHHQLLKTKMQEDESFISAHVGYDFDSNKPTYELIVGTPGSSMALTIFEKLSQKFNIDSSIIKDAKSILDKKYVTYERLLQDLSRKKSELERLLIDNKSLNAQLKNQKKSMEGVLFLEKQSSFEHYKNKLDKQLKKINDLKKSNLTVKQIQNEASKIRSGLLSHDPNQQKKEETVTKNKVEQLVIGSLYFCDRFNANCELLSLSKKKAQVKLKGKTVQVPVDSLFIKNSMGQSSKQNNKKSEKVKINVFKSTINDLNVDGRGMRLEPFQNQVLSGLEALSVGEIPYLLIVHGHGEGILKKWLRDYMRKERDFTWMPEEGNDGCTRIELKKD